MHLRPCLLAFAAAAAVLLGTSPVPAAAAAHGASGPPIRMPVADAVHRAASTSTASSIPLTSGGGSIQSSPAVYLSFWGPQWQSGFTTGGYSSGSAQTYLQQFFSGVGGSSWIASTEQYCQGVAVGAAACPTSATFIGSPTSQLKGSWIDTTAVPTTPGDPDIQAAAERAFQHFGITADATYFVVTPTGHSESGFGTQWCAWHTSDYYSGRQVAYAYLPYLPDAGTSCGRNYINSTNDAFGHGYFDGFSIVGGHEYAEAVTDPNPNSGWTDANGDEIGDKCQWSNGPAGTATLSSGSFAVQSLWSNAAAGCVLSSAAVPPPPRATAPPPPPPPPPTTGGLFTPLPTARILDTRVSLGGVRLGPGATISVPVAGQGGVPATGVDAALINVTAVNGTAPSYLTVFPSSSGVPTASTVNFLPHAQAANLAQVRLGPDGRVNVYNGAGSVDAIFDVEGYVSSASGSAGLYEPLPGPSRIYDTRSGPGRLGPGETRTIPVAGLGGIPASGAAAVVLNVTSVQGTAPSYLSVTADGSSSVSTVNFAPYDVRANRAYVKVGSDGQVRVYNSQGWVDVVIDVAGWFTGSATTSSTGAHYSSVAPFRILDTRPATKVGPSTGPVGPQQSLRLPVAGVGGIPAGATTVVLNVTATDATTWSYLTAYPAAPTPVASDLNYGRGETIANLVVVAVAADGSIQLYNDQGWTDVVADVEGWYA